MKIIIGLIQRGIEVTNPRITPVYHFLKRNIKRAPLTTYQIRNCKIFADPTFCTFHTAITRRPCVKININYRNYKTLGNFFQRILFYIILYLKLLVFILNVARFQSSIGYQLTFVPTFATSSMESYSLSTFPRKNGGTTHDLIRIIPQYPWRCYTWRAIIVGRVSG